MLMRCQTCASDVGFCYNKTILKQRLKSRLVVLGVNRPSLTNDSIGAKDE